MQASKAHAAPNLGQPSHAAFKATAASYLCQVITNSLEVCADPAFSMVLQRPAKPKYLRSIRLDGLAGVE